MRRTAETIILLVGFIPLLVLIAVCMLADLTTRKDS